MSRASFRAYRSVALGVAWRTPHNLFTTPNCSSRRWCSRSSSSPRSRAGCRSCRSLPGSTSRPGYTAFQFVVRAAPVGGVRRRVHGLRDRARLRVGFARRFMLAAPHRARSSPVTRWRRSSRWRDGAPCSPGRARARDGGGGTASTVVGLYHARDAGQHGRLLLAAGVAMRFRTCRRGPLMQIRCSSCSSSRRSTCRSTCCPAGSTRSRRSTRRRLSSRPGAGSSPARRSTSRSRSALCLALVVFALWAMLGIRSAEAAGG